MPFGDGIANLRSELDGAPHVHRTPGHLISQRRTGSELVGEIALVAFFDHVEERRDVRMVQRLRGPRLFKKPATALRTGDERSRDLLSRAAALPALSEGWREHFRKRLLE